MPIDKQTFLELFEGLKPIDDISKIDQLIDELLKIEKWDDIDFAFAKAEIEKSIINTAVLKYLTDKWQELDLDDMIVYQAEQREKLKRQKELNKRAKQKRAPIQAIKLVDKKDGKTKKKKQNTKKEEVKGVKKKKKKKKSLSKGAAAKAKKSRVSASKNKENNGKQPYARIIYTPMRG